MAKQLQSFTVPQLQLKMMMAKNTKNKQTNTVSCIEVCISVSIKIMYGPFVLNAQYFHTADNKSHICGSYSDYSLNMVNMVMMKKLVPPPVSARCLRCLHTQASRAVVALHNVQSIVIKAFGCIV